MIQFNENGRLVNYKIYNTGLKQTMESIQGPQLKILKTTELFTEACKI